MTERHGQAGYLNSFVFTDGHLRSRSLVDRTLQMVDTPCRWDDDTDSMTKIQRTKSQKTKSQKTKVITDETVRMHAVHLDIVCFPGHTCFAF